MALLETPPPRSIAASASAHGSVSGFPLGYFMIRSLATGRVLDVGLSHISDDTEVVLWEQTEKSLVEGIRDRAADNQLFFIDATGALCSKHSGHAIDITDGMLVLRHRRPITHPYPNKYSHDLPRFSYNPVSGNIFVKFTSNPSFPDPHSQVPEPPTPPTPPEADDEDEEGESRSHLATPFQITNGSSSSIEISVPEKDKAKAMSNSPQVHIQGRDRGPTAFQPPPTSRRRASELWEGRIYLLTALPSRKPKTLFDDAAAFLSNTASILTTPLAIGSFSFPFSLDAPASSSAVGHTTSGSGDVRQPLAVQHIESGEYDLRENEIVEEERAEAEEVDDDPDPSRRVKVYGFRPRHLAEGAGNPRGRERRRWEIVPIRKERRRF